MKRTFLTILTLALIASFVACAAPMSTPSLEPAESALPVEITNPPASSVPATSAPEQQGPSSGNAQEPASTNILIAYFTWAENTHVENPDAVDVDATTSARVLLPGNAAKLAGWIQQEVGGDLFSIVVTEPYSSDYDECLDRAADELAANARPALVNHVENMDDYDIVFLGFPNWWYTVPMAVHTFLEEYDFSGKTIVPFVTHGTGGLSSTIRDMTANLPDTATILEPIGIYRPEVDAAQPRIQEWLNGLELPLNL